MPNLNLDLHSLELNSLLVAATRTCKRCGMSNMLKSAGVYGGLLALLMGASWVRWTAEPEPDLEGKVALLQGESNDIDKIVWLSTDKDRAVIEKKTDESGDYLWVTYTRWKEKKKEHDHGKDEADHASDAHDAAEGDGTDHRRWRS